MSLTQAGLEALFESNLLDDLKNVMKTNDVVRYRVYEVKHTCDSYKAGYSKLVMESKMA